MAILWPDGVVTEGVRRVKLACGHERVSRGWRGAEGERYRCDVCHVLTVIEEARPTELEPCDWRPRRVLMTRPSAPFEPIQWPALTSFAHPGLFDPVADARAGLRYIQERYAPTGRHWEAYATGAYRAFARWPLSPGPRSMHGDALLASPACSSHVS